jgi:hypothetical protein
MIDFIVIVDSGGVLPVHANVAENVSPLVAEFGNEGQTSPPPPPR